ncbi:hypothetical protein S40288_10875 [Stachybotrys chartarum IBT 40288]|nr:hypothetical protein S40288_10875 [Stachybotrys chartarum IBT 40288]
MIDARWKLQGHEGAFTQFAGALDVSIITPSLGTFLDGRRPHRVFGCFRPSIELRSLGVNIVHRSPWTTAFLAWAACGGKEKQSPALANGNVTKTSGKKKYEHHGLERAGIRPRATTVAIYSAVLVNCCSGREVHRSCGHVDEHPTSTGLGKTDKKLSAQKKAWQQKDQSMKPLALAIFRWEC